MRLTPRGYYYSPLAPNVLASVRTIGRAVVDSRLPVFALATMLVSRCTDPQHRRAIGSFGDLALALAYLGALDASPGHAHALRDLLPRLTPAALDALGDLLALANGAEFVNTLLDAERMQRAGMLAAPWFFEISGTKIRVGAIVAPVTVEA